MCPLGKVISSRERPDTEPPTQRDQQIVAINWDGRMKWQAATGYGTRALVEAAIVATSRSSVVHWAHEPSSATGRGCHRLRPSQIVCLRAHTRNPSVALEPARK